MIAMNGNNSRSRSNHHRVAARRPRSKRGLLFVALALWLGLITIASTVQSFAVVNSNPNSNDPGSSSSSSSALEFCSRNNIDDNCETSSPATTEDHPHRFGDNNVFVEATTKLTTTTTTTTTPTTIVSHQPNCQQQQQLVSVPVPVPVLPNAQALPPREAFVPRIAELLHTTVNRLVEEARTRTRTRTRAQIHDVVTVSSSSSSGSGSMGRDDAEFLAERIVESMETEHRLFHSTNHVFHVLGYGHDNDNDNDNGHDDPDPALVLMVLFHDMIYYTVDHSFREFQLELLEDVLVFRDDDHGNNNNNGNSSSSSSSSSNDQNNHRQHATNGVNNDDNINNININNNNNNEFYHQKPVARRTPVLPLALSPNAVNLDPLLGAVVSIFGFEDSAVYGKPLPNRGLNEFLSAVLATRLLSEWLLAPDLLRIAIGIEGTVPFRPPDENGTSVSDQLYHKLQQQQQQQQKQQQQNTNALIAATIQNENNNDNDNDNENENDDYRARSSWLDRTMELYIEMSHRDLSSLSTTDPRYFVDSTWSLLPESNPALLLTPEQEPGDGSSRSPSLATVSRAIGGLSGTTAFLQNAVPNMYPSFRGQPSPGVISELEARTRANLEIGDRYAAVRLLQVTLLEDLVVIAGGDPEQLPAAEFLRIGERALATATKTKTKTATATIVDGTATNNFRRRARTADDDQNENDDDSFGTVRSLLAGNRNSFAWDPSRSPLGEALYEGLGGSDGIERALEGLANDCDRDCDRLATTTTATTTTTTTTPGGERLRQRNLPKDLVEAAAEEVAIVLGWQDPSDLVRAVAVALLPTGA
eukprot:jgi/Psemu1/3089/gm1.3089_g